MSPEYSREWRRKAEADRAAAKRAFQDCRRRKDQAEIACFHAQQCVEKYLKAVLAKNGRPVRRVHDLLALSQEVQKHGLKLAAVRKSLVSLQQYAVEIRYPGASAGVADAAKAIRNMEILTAKIQPLLID